MTEITYARHWQSFEVERLVRSGRTLREALHLALPYYSMSNPPTSEVADDAMRLLGIKFGANGVEPARESFSLK